MDFERERISDKLSGIQTFKDLFPSICISWSNKRYSLLHKLQGLCAWKSASLFWYLSVTLTANLTSYSFDLHLPSRPLNIYGETSLFPFSGQENMPTAVMWLTARARICCRSQSMPYPVQYAIAAWIWGLKFPLCSLWWLWGCSMGVDIFSDHLWALVQSWKRAAVLTTIPYTLISQCMVIWQFSLVM